MSRPRLYNSSAEKQAAYRRRLSEETLLVDRRAIERLEQRLERLRDAVLCAADREDPLARKCVGGSTDTVVEKLTALFASRPTSEAEVTKQAEVPRATGNRRKER